MPWKNVGRPVSKARKQSINKRVYSNVSLYPYSVEIRIKGKIVCFRVNDERHAGALVRKFGQREGRYWGAGGDYTVFPNGSYAFRDAKI